MNRLLAAGAVLLAMAPPLLAQSLAARHYDTEDGLGHNLVYGILQDREGYVWIATYEGVSRFDGIQFVTYGVRDGFPHAIATGLAEDASGRLWVANFSGGLSQITDDRRRPVGAPVRVGRTEHSNEILAIAAPRDGTLFCIASDGVYRGHARGSGFDFERVMDIPSDVSQPPVLQDRAGHVWAGIEDRAVRFSSGRVETFDVRSNAGAAAVTAFTEDAAGRIYVATTRGVSVADSPGAPATTHWNSVPIALASGEQVRSLLITTSGRLWIGTTRGVWLREPGTEPRPMRIRGLDDAVRVLYEDHDGNVWAGTEHSGVYLIPRDLVEVFSTEDGLLHPAVRRVVEGIDGRIYVTADSSVFEVSAAGLQPLEGAASPRAVQAGARIARDGLGRWWLAADSAIYRSRGAQLRLDGFDEVHPGFPGTAAWSGAAVYADPLGRVWVSTPGADVWRFDSRSPFAPPVVTHVSNAPNFGAGRMALDRGGNLWVGSYGEVVRVRPDGRIENARGWPGLPHTLSRALFVDSRGWLWIGLRYDGIALAREPAADRPVFASYSTATGLSSDAVWAFCEDAEGRVYAGTGRGLDRIDPATGVIRRFSRDAGTAGGAINDCHVDARGNVWIASMLGLSRLVPAAQAPAPRGVRITRLRANGEDIGVGVRGVARLDDVPLAAGANITVDFLVPEALPIHRYRYRLGSSTAPWSAASPRTSLSLPRLTPGKYQLAIQAVDDQGAVTNPAILSFDVPPPIWQRSWFIASLLAFVAAAALTFHRSRVAQAVALERVRQQVAFDLHDDIGTGLTEIAMLSEVARRDPGRAPGALGEAARLARDLRDAMGDIVWSVDPRKDTAASLVQRMRQTAYGLLESNGTPVTLTAPPEAALAHLALPPDHRRHLFLIFKEAVANAARHAGAKRVRISLEILERVMQLTVDDDGKGFDTSVRSSGHGLTSMHGRAEGLGGTLTIVSTPGAGTTVRASIPLKSRSTRTDVRVATARADR